MSIVFYTPYFPPNSRSVEAGCQPTRNQGDAPLSHPGQRRLPQVHPSSTFSSSIVTIVLQIQQAMRVPTFICTQDISSPSPRPVPRPHGSTVAIKTLRHGRPQLVLKTERRREQTYCCCFLQTATCSFLVHVQNGRDR